MPGGLSHAKNQRTVSGAVSSLQRAAVSSEEDACRDSAGSEAQGLLARSGKNSPEAGQARAAGKVRAGIARVLLSETLLLAERSLRSPRHSPHSAR